MLKREKYVIGITIAVVVVIVSSVLLMQKKEQHPNNHHLQNSALESRQVSKSSKTERNKQRRIRTKPALETEQAVEINQPHIASIKYTSTHGSTKKSTGTSELSGFVSDPEGDAVTGAEISYIVFTSESNYTKHEHGFFDKKTDATGYYEQKKLVSGKYYIFARHEDFEPSNDKEVELSNNESASNVDLSLGSLDGSGKASGKVFDNFTREGVPNATVKFSRYVKGDGTARGISLSVETMTDTDGMFSLEGIPTGKYAAQVAADSYETYSSFDEGFMFQGKAIYTIALSIANQSERNNLKYELIRKGSIGGFVLTHTAQPLFLNHLRDVASPVKR